jgi:hypothetical protein
MTRDTTIGTLHPIKRVFSPSPKGPIKQTEKWCHPGRWADRAGERRTPGRPKAAPPINVVRVEDRVVLEFDFGNLDDTAQPVAVVVNANATNLKTEPPRTFTFNVEDQRSARIETTIKLAPGVTYEARIAVTTKDGKPSAPLIMPLDPPRTPRTTVLTRIATILRPLQERIIHLFNKPRGEGP